MVAYAAPLLIVVAGLVVLVAADGPAPQAGAGSEEPFRGYPDSSDEPFRGVVRTTPRLTVQVTVQCPAVGKSPWAAYATECKLRQQTAVAQACADPETETVELLVLLVAPDGHTVNGVSDSVYCGVRRLLVT